MPRFNFVTVDVFTDRRFGGNPLAVFPDAQGLSDAEMQAFANWTNLSETTFLLPPTDAAAEGGTHALGWIDERTSLSGAARWMMFRKVPKGTNWFYTLGSATMFAFLSQAVTGVVLAMYYVPSANGAYNSIRHINNDVFLGEFVHGMHRWGSSVMVILVFLHMGRTFFFGAYKYPRELNWVIGVLLLMMTMAMGFTGYLLPFDQRSFWATVVGVNLNGTGPIIGPYLADFLRAGPDFGVTTLPRFYSIHMMLLPGLIGSLIAIHAFPG